MHVVCSGLVPFCLAMLLTGSKRREDGELSSRSGQAFTFPGLSRDHDHAVTVPSERTHDQLMSFSAWPQVPVTDGGQLLVSPEYLRHLTKLANEKMEQNWARIERFHALFKQRFLAGEPAALLSGSHGIGQRRKTGGHVASSNSAERRSERISAAVVDAEAAEAVAGENYYVIPEGSVLRV